MKRIVTGARFDLVGFLQLTPEEKEENCVKLVETARNIAQARALVDQRLREAIDEHRSDSDT